MKKFLFASAIMFSALASAAPAHAQKEMMSTFYGMAMAPKVCAWTNAASPAKLTATIALQEKALGVTSDERATMMKAAEKELRSDPTNCAVDGMVRMMYDEAVK